MKRILITLSLVLILSQIAFAQDYKSFMASLNLSEKQEKRINEIEKKYKAEIVQLRANIILRNMQMAKAGANPKGQNMVDAEFGALQDEMEILQKEKEDEIASSLRLIQRFKYRNFCRRNICN